MTEALWIAWYDLDEAVRARAIEDAHARLLPALAAAPGIAWAAHYETVGGGPAMREIMRDVIARPDEAVGSGSGFILMAAAASVGTFFELAFSTAELEAAPRRGVRTGVFLEQARVTGPALGDAPPGGLPAPAIQLGSFRTRSVADEFDLGRWYVQYRLPHMAGMTGALRTRKLVSVAGWAKHAVLYEFSSLEARLAEFERPHEALALDPAEWTGRIVRYTVHAPGSPNVARRIWPPIR